MKKDGNKRRSHCSVCGKRLSKKTPTGDIQWHPSLIDDQGFYCDTCYKDHEAGKPHKKPRT